MFKQEEYTILPPDFNDSGSMVMEQNFMVTDSPPMSLDFSDNILPLIGEGELLMLSRETLEDTMDAAKYQPQVFEPVSPTGPPERRVFAGNFDFQVEINARDTNRKKYLYSDQLNRIYVDMKTDFPVSFRYDGGGPAAFVRATVVFSDESQAEKRVERCTQHTHEAANADIEQAIVKNVLHSSRERGTRGVYYCGQPGLPDSWYSVLVELGPTGGSHAYQFVCKNSCSSGINRRAIDVIFTLEDASGRVYGRQSVGARVCSCPRRDMSRDEDDSRGRAGKRRVQPATPPPNPATQKSKKVKVERVDTGTVDETVITLPPIEIVGVRAAVTGLQVMLSVMEAAQAARPQPRAARVIAALREQIHSIRRTHAYEQL